MVNPDSRQRFIVSVVVFFGDFRALSDRSDRIVDSR